jgi:translation elongation factor EF-4
MTRGRKRKLLEKQKEGKKMRQFGSFYRRAEGG